MWGGPLGGEFVVMPIVEETSNHPSRIPVPRWVETWLRSLHEAMHAVPFHLVGASRGAAWGVKLLGTSLKFNRAVLIAPYYQGCWRDSVAQIERAVEGRLQRDPTSIKIVYGSADSWPPPASLLDLVRNTGCADSAIELRGYKHDETLRSMANFWFALTGP